MKRGLLEGLTFELKSEKAKRGAVLGSPGEREIGWGREGGRESERAGRW